MKTFHVGLVKAHGRMNHKYLLDGDCSEAAFNECCREADRAHAALYPDRPDDVNIRGIIHAALMREAEKADTEGCHGGDIVLDGLGVRLRYSRQLHRDRIKALLPD
jgi:hypothetical protein